MPVPGRWLRLYARREIFREPPCQLDRRLAAWVARVLYSALKEMNALPEDHPIWKITNREPTLGKMPNLVEARRKLDPSDVRATQIAAACSVHCMSSGAAVSLLPLVDHDTRVLVWMAHVSELVWQFSGADSGPALSRALKSVAAKRGDLGALLDRWETDPDPLVRRAARIVRAFLNGQGWRDLKGLGPVPVAPRRVRPGTESPPRGD